MASLALAHTRRWEALLCLEEPVGEGLGAQRVRAHPLLTAGNGAAATSCQPRDLCGDLAAR